MIYNLEPKSTALGYLLGDIDQLDVNYILSSGSNTNLSSVLFCLNNSLLDTLYKYDQFSNSYNTDWTDVGHMECLSLNAEFISDTVIKLNVIQKFVRCFSFKKESLVTGTETSVDFISVYPKMFLDTETTDLDTILSAQEKTNLVNSKLLNVEYSSLNGYWLPSTNTTASHGVVLPSNLDLFTFVDANVNYPKQKYDVTNGYSGEIYSIDLWYDSAPAEDKYSAWSKAFNVINDSTIIMEFEFYINAKQFNYLMDINDINIHYHLNVNSPVTIPATGTFDITVYEKMNGYFVIDDVIYIKNIYNDTVIALAKVLNITNNTLTLSLIWSAGTLTIAQMDKYFLNKIKNLENFNEIQRSNNILRAMIANNIFVIKGMEFKENDYLALNNLG